uniref:Kunitz/Bovine pancreatic trypsin inhibitor domain protein n=1 Tax=Strongyloides papillosus TaxID=174720 RepID=A0A0N5BN77_STREA
MGSIFCIISFFILLSISSCAQFDSHNERCNLFPERGTCQHEFQMKWYYHPYSGKCKKFFYSGCDGNDNRFDSEEECLSQCTYGREGQEIENYKRCHEPYDKGDCWGSFERWYFDTDKGECICTNYTGCGGTGNKFYSFNHCMEICGDFSKNNYQKNYYERSEHGKAKRQRLQNYNQQLPRRQESDDINLQAQQQYYDSRIQTNLPSYDQRYQEELRQRQEQLARQDDLRYQEELRQRQEHFARQDDPRYQEELRQRQEQHTRQDDLRYQEELRQRQEHFARQDDPRYQEELRHRQEQLARQDDPRYQEELRHRQEQLARQDDPRYQEELRHRQEQLARQDDPRYQEELRQRQEQHTRQDDPRYIQQQREYEERLQEYYRRRDEFMKQHQSQKTMNVDSERQDLHRQSRPVSLSEDLSHGNSLTVEDVIPHDPHPWHQVEAQFPARRRWVRKFHKRSSNKNVENDNEVKNRKTRSTYQSNQVNYNVRL